MKNSEIKQYSADFRQKATELLKDKQTKANPKFSECDSLKLIHELEVHQIELELINEELNNAVEKSELIAEKYTNLYDFATSSYYTLTKEGIITELNLQGATILNKERSGLINCNFNFFVSNETRPIFSQFLKKVFSSANKETCDVTIVVDKIAETFVNISGIASENGENCFITVIDITDHKKLFETYDFLLKCGLPGSGEDFFESLAIYLAKNLDMDYICIDRLEGDGLSAQTIAVYNDGKIDPNVSYALKDTPCGDVVGKTICCFPEDVCNLFPNDAALQDLKAVSYIGTTLWSFDGNPIGLIAVIGQKPLKNVSYAETILKLVAVRAAAELEREIAANEILKAKEKVEQSENRLIDAQAVAKVGSWETDLLSLDVIWSKETYRMFELDPSHLKASHSVFMNFVHPEDKEMVDLAFVESCGKEGVNSIEHRIVINGIIKHVEERWRIVKDNQNNPIKAIGTCQDITQRKKNEEELRIAKDKAEESDRLKSAFLANMSHEIRTPMNGILGFADLLKTPDLNGEKQQEYIKIIESSGNRMLSIINDIIDISKIESGLIDVSISQTDINEQIEYVCSFFKPEIEKKGLQIKCNKSLPANEVICFTDREKIYAVLINLVKNAIKFTNEGYVELGYRKKDKEILFYVKDTGAGISNEQLEIVFERFRQGCESLTRNYEGAGLGLSISKAYVEMLGGKIWAESEIGKGSTFYFTVPMNIEQKNGNVVENKTLEVADNYITKDLKILLVENDLISEKLAMISIEKFSKNILVARNGVEAVQTCRNNPDIDLILMDIKLPELNGYEATKQIRQFNKEVIIFAQTDYALSGEREIAMEAGCNDYVSKPFIKTSFNNLMKMYF